MAHTGICMLTGDDFGIYHEYIEKIMGRPVWTHELAVPEIAEEITEKSLNDILELCKNATD